MVRGPLVAAAVTLLQVAAQGGSAAEFDGAHHAPLPARERICVLLPVRQTIAAKDIRHFELRTLHRPRGSEILRCRRLRFSGHRLREQIEGAGGRTNLAGGDAEILEMFCRTFDLLCAVEPYVE